MFINEPELGPVECRICHSKTTRDLILSPCLCKGSMGCVHTRCLEQWLNISSHNYCELCSYRFEVIQVRRYSLLKSLRIWICQDQGSLYKAIFFIVLSATNSILLSWMWFLWLSNIPSAFIKDSDNSNKNKETEILDQETQDISRPKWMAVFVFLTLLTLFSIKSLCFDGYKAIKNQYHAWYRWWNETVNVQLVLDLENYKIKNKLEESRDISLKYIREKASVPDQNSGTNYKIADFQTEEILPPKFSYDIPDIHKARKPSTESIIGINNVTSDVGITIIDDELEKSLNVIKVVVEEEGTKSSEMFNGTTATDVPQGTCGPEQNFPDLSEVHDQNHYG